MMFLIAGALNYHGAEERYIPTIPLGALACAAVLESKGWDVEVVDPNLLVSTSKTPRQNIYGDIAEILLKKKAIAIGFSTHGRSYHQSLRIAELIKKRSPRIPIIFGGPQASVLDELTIKHFPQVDIIVRNEGEYTLAALLDRLAKGEPPGDIAGITYRSNGSCIRNRESEPIADLDELPIPAYHLYPLKSSPSIPLDVARGCASHCSICAACTLWGTGKRLKSVKRIVEEIKYLSRRFGKNCFEISQDLFASHREHLLELCDRILAEGLRIKWACAGRIESLDAKTLKTMAKSGCSTIAYEIESGSQEVQQQIGRKLKPEKILSCVRYSVQAGLNVEATYTTGFPMEREDDFRKTITMIIQNFLEGRKKISQSFAPLIPYAGSEIYDEHRENLFYNGYRPPRQELSPYDRESIVLIRKYPQVFPDNYHTAMKFLKREMIEEFIDLIMLPMTITPSSAAVLWEQVRDPVALYKDWRQYNESLMEKERYRADPLRGDGHRLFARVFQDFIVYMVRSRFIRVDYLADLIEYETSLYTLRKKEKRKEGATGRTTEFLKISPDEERFLSLKPVREKDLMQKTYEYDVKKLAFDILERGAGDGGSLRGVKQERHMVLCWQPVPGSADSLNVDERALRILDACKGKKTVNEIVLRFQDRKEKRKTGAPEGEIRELMREWFRRGLIRFIFPEE